MPELEYVPRLQINTLHTDRNSDQQMILLQAQQTTIMVWQSSTSQLYLSVHCTAPDLNRPSCTRPGLIRQCRKNIAGLMTLTDQALLQPVDVIKPYNGLHNTDKSAQGC